MNGKVLIVEDQRALLNDFQKIFFSTGITVFKAETAVQGLKILDEEDIDVVVSHFRMHKRDGLQFLKEVRKEHPSVYRVLTSGFLDETMVFKFVSSGLICAFMVKPWKPDIVQGRITHILKVKIALQEKKLLDLINSIEKLPTLPYLFREMLLAMESNKSMQEIASVIKKDTSVSAKVIHVVNSAFFGREDISQVEEAAVYLGESVLKDIVLTAYLIDNTKWKSGQIKHLKEIFFHSFMVNKYIPVIYKLVYGKTFSKSDPSVGIIHDIGKIIILQYFPDRYESIVSEPGDSDFYHDELALGFEGYTHSEIGAYFLDWWNFPEVMVEAALFHHRPEKALSEYQHLFQVVNYTDKMVNYVWSKRNTQDLDFSRFYVKNVDRELIDKITQNLINDTREYKNIFDRLI